MEDKNLELALGLLFLAGFGAYVLYKKYKVTTPPTGYSIMGGTTQEQQTQTVYYEREYPIPQGQIGAVNPYIEVTPIL